MIFKRAFQLLVGGFLGHFRQGFHELIFGIVKVPKLIDEQILEIFELHGVLLGQALKDREGAFSGVGCAMQVVPGIRICKGGIGLINQPSPKDIIVGNPIQALILLSPDKKYMA